MDEDVTNSAGKWEVKGRTPFVCFRPSQSDGA